MPIRGSRKNYGEFNLRSIRRARDTGRRYRVSGPLPNGERYENTVFQFMTLRWGKVSSVETIEDLQILERALKVVAASGKPEAIADPILD